MTIEWKDGVLRCAGTLAVDDAEALLQLLLDAGAEIPAAPVADLSACEHVHSACLQVLMGAGVAVAAWPAGDVLAAWLRAALAAPTTDNNR
jgi:anti-anti-sigma regulatory factor